ncbi:hypothetical protein K8I28_04395 [bacterium]|nr:hypothetical protein [bacterium]
MRSESLAMDKAEFYNIVVSAMSITEVGIRFSYIRDYIILDIVYRLKTCESGKLYIDDTCEAYPLEMYLEYRALALQNKLIKYGLTEDVGSEAV